MKNIVDIKGTKYGLAIQIKSSSNIEDIKDSLKVQFNKAKGFFEGAEFFIEPEGSIDKKDKEALEIICKEYGLIPKSKDFEIDAKKDSFNNRSITSYDEITLFETGLLPEELDETNHMINGSIRNGQNLRFSGNVVLLGDVNPGAQISATGSIIVLGALKWTVHAGAEGDRDSFVLAYDLTPNQVRIAKTVARNPDGIPEKTNGPEIARLENDIIVVEKYQKKKKA